MKTTDEHDPETAAIILKLGKKKPSGGDSGDDSEPDGDEGGEGDTSEEAKSAAAEDVLQAVKDRDADALKGALESFMKACSY